MNPEDIINPTDRQAWLNSSRRLLSDACAAELDEFNYLFSSEYQKAYAEAKSAVPDAIKQLERSERGKRALLHFRTMLENGGNGLDAKNWLALEALIVRRSILDVQSAISQLRGSERGCRALKDLVRLMNNGGWGLDFSNLEALAAICRAGGYLG
jgi:hypothetical protein